LLAVLLLGALYVGTRASHGPMTEDQRVLHVASQIRCPVCEGQSAAQSDSPVSRAIRDDIRQRIEAGQSDRQILSYLVSRYPGDLLNPQAKGIGLVVWTLPVVALLFAVVVLALAFERWRNRPRSEPSADDEVLVDSALRK
jgi:cytochrome c-type biogenesis protein CcmH